MGKGGRGGGGGSSGGRSGGSRSGGSRSGGSRSGGSRSGSGGGNSRKTTSAFFEVIPASTSAPASAPAPASTTITTSTTPSANFFDKHREAYYTKRDFTQINYIFPIIFIVLGLPLLIVLVQWIIKKISNKSETNTSVDKTSTSVNV